MKRFLGCIAAMAVALNGCATPIPIKQALKDKDDAYARNIALATQYHTLVEQTDARIRLWYVYVQSRVTLSAAIKWITTNPQPPTGVSAEEDVDINQQVLLDPALVKKINQLRLKNLPERKGVKPPTGEPAVFAAGTKGNLDDLIKAAPELARLSREFAARSFDDLVKPPAKGPPAGLKKTTSAAPDAYAKYIAAVTVLRQLNAAEKAYLDIDVTVKSDDVRALADSVKTLAKSK